MSKYSQKHILFLRAFFLWLFLFFKFTSQTFAQGFTPPTIPPQLLVLTPTPIPNCENTDLGCVPNSPIEFIQKFYAYGLGFIGGVGILFIIFGGYLLLTSQGNAIQVQTGKSYIMYAVVGILLAIFGYVFVQIVVVDVLHIPGFS